MNPRHIFIYIKDRVPEGDGKGEREKESGEESLTASNSRQNSTFPAPMIFSAAYTESPHLEHFSAPPYF